MTDDSRRATAEVAATRDEPHHTERDNSRPGEACGEVPDLARLDLEDVADRLRVMGVRCRLGEDGLWAGKLCLHAHGEVSVDGRVRGLDPAHLGQRVEGFIEALRRIGLVPQGPERLALSKGDGKRGPPWRLLPRLPPRRLKGRRAERAIQRMHAFLEENELGYEQLGPGRFLICRRVYYNPPSGRIRLKGSRMHPVKGLDALTKVLVEEANNPKLGHLYPQSLRQDGLGVLVTDDPLERMWAGSMAARALAMATRSRPARGAVAQKG